MVRSTSRVRTSVACVALAVVLAGCGSVPNAAAPPGPEPDLFVALPAPASVPTTTSAMPPPTTAAPTTTRKPTGAVAPRGAERARSVRVVADAPAPKGTSDPGAGAGWRPVSGDEFNAGSLNTKKWLRYDSVGGFGNGFRRPEAISQSDGTLKITAKGDVSGGMAHSAGRLHGRWEFRARTDAGRGFGSAILLWPDSEKWPRDGEIDIMEVPFETRDLAHFVVHWGPDGVDRVHGGSVPGDYTTWHTFVVEWLPDRITWYVDGVKKYETTDVAQIPTKPMHLAIQLDQGPMKDWIKAPDATTPAEINLEVDWVRVYAPAS